MTEPKFKLGELVRYGSADHDLMLIDTVSPDHAGPGTHKYYGVQCRGGRIGLYELDLEAANLPHEQLIWARYIDWRDC